MKKYMKNLLASLLCAALLALSNGAVPALADELEIDWRILLSLTVYLKNLN